MIRFRSLRRQLALPAVAMLLSWGSAHAGPLAWITNQGSHDVSVVDLTSETVIDTVPVGRSPAGVAASPSAHRVYITNPGSNEISAIDVATRKVVATASVGQGAVGIEAAPDGKRVYVSDWFGARLIALDASSLAPLFTVALGASPAGIAVSPDSRTVYVAERDDNRIAVIDVGRAGHPRIVKRIAVGEHPFGLMLDTRRRRLYSIDVYADRLTVIDLKRHRVSGTVKVGKAPYGAALARGSDGRERIFVTNQRADTVSVIDAQSLETLATLNGFGFPEGIAARGDAVYVVNWMDDEMQVIDATTGDKRKRIPLGSNPRGFGAFIVE